MHQTRKHPHSNHRTRAALALEVGGGAPFLSTPHFGSRRARTVQSWLFSISFPPLGRLRSAAATLSLARRLGRGSRASRPLRPKMEALHLHPAPQAAADEAAMHGAGPMQARFSPYDYNGGSVHAPGRAKALPLTGKKSCRCSLWPFPVTHALAVCLTLRVPFAGPCLPSRARILPSSPATRAAARASPSCPATSARSTRCELAGCARAPARARESKERRLRFSP